VTAVELAPPPPACETLQRLQAEGQPGFDPYRVQWRSDRLEWIIKNGFADWFMEESDPSAIRRGRDAALEGASADQVDDEVGAVPAGQPCTAPTKSLVR
jgi:hypothetical protein